MRMLTYLPGSILAEAKPRTPRMLEAVGRFLGELDSALAGFSHSAARHSDLVWNPARALEVIDQHVGAIADPDHRALVAHFVQTSDATLAPLIHKLRTGVIHNDANDYNILVGPPSLEERPIAGLLDFGDMLETWIACEPAVAMAYAMFERARPAGRRGPRGARLSLRAPPERGGGGGALDAGRDPAVHQRLPVRASALGRTRQRLSAGLRRPGLADAPSDASHSSALGPLHAACGVRHGSVPSDPRGRGLARVARRRARSGADRGHRSVRGPGPLGVEPRLRDPGAGHGRRRHDPSALRTDARRQGRRRHRPLRRGPAALRERRFRGRRGRASRAADRPPRDRPLRGTGIPRSGSPSGHGPCPQRQRAAAGLRAHRHPRAPPEGRSGFLHAVRAPLARVPATAEPGRACRAKPTHRSDRRAARQRRLAAARALPDHHRPAGPRRRVPGRGRGERTRALEIALPRSQPHPPPPRRPAGSRDARRRAVALARRAPGAAGTVALAGLPVAA